MVYIYHQSYVLSLVIYTLVVGYLEFILISP